MSATVECVKHVKGMARRGHGARAVSGFTLIEVLTGLAVVAMIMTAVSSLSIGTIRSNRTAQQVTAATNLARDKIEELRGLDYWTITDGADPQPLTESGTAGGAGAIFTRSWSVYLGPTNGTLFLKVTVRWQDGTTREVAVRTIIGS